MCIKNFIETHTVSMNCNNVCGATNTMTGGHYGAAVAFNSECITLGNEITRSMDTIASLMEDTNEQVKHRPAIQEWIV